jgi:hypothetical protein
VHPHLLRDRLSFFSKLGAAPEIGKIIVVVDATNPDRGARGGGSGGFICSTHSWLFRTGILELPFGILDSSDARLLTKQKRQDHREWFG